MRKITKKKTFNNKTVFYSLRLTAFLVFEVTPEQKESFFTTLQKI